MPDQEAYMRHGDQDDRPVVGCPKCGYEEIVKLPLPVSQFTYILNGFAARHRGCKPAEESEVPCG